MIPRSLKRPMGSSITVAALTIGLRAMLVWSASVTWQCARPQWRPLRRRVSKTEHSQQSSPSSSSPTRAETGDSFKKDAGKLMWALLPYDAMTELVRVYTLGATKYRPRGWEEGMEFDRIFSAMMR